jgi:hypothetical protein
MLQLQGNLNMAAADLKIDEETDEVIDELKENYPLVAQILDKVPDMNIEEAGTITLLVDGVRWLGKLHALRLLRMEDKTISDEIIQSKIMEIKQKEPLLGHILDRMHHIYEPWRDLYRTISNGWPRAYPKATTGAGA